MSRRCSLVIGATPLLLCGVLLAGPLVVSAGKTPGARQAGTTTSPLSAASSQDARFAQADIKHKPEGNRLGAEAGAGLTPGAAAATAATATGPVRYPTNLGAKLPLESTGHRLTGARGGILYAPAAADNQSFREEVSALSAGIGVDYFDARIGTPGADLLATYSVVFTWVEFPYDDAGAFGDNLAEYVDAGGTVILGQWCCPTALNYLSGRIMEVGYCPVTAGSYGSGIYVGDGTSCIHADVTTYVASYRDNCTLQGDGVQDGSYHDGYLSHAYRPDQRVFYSAGSAIDYASGDWAQLIANMAVHCGEPRYGACCDDLTETCTDGVELRACGPARFAVDTLCADLDPACGAARGACCTGFACGPNIPAYICDLLNGSFQGPGSDCDPNPCTWGACCFADTSCAELNPTECSASAGMYMGNLIDCEDVECPQGAQYDECADAPIDTLTAGEMLTWIGSNLGATSDCAALAGPPEEWRAFETAEFLNVVIDYCGTAPSFANAYLVLEPSCPCSGEFAYASFWDNTSCGDGNLSIHWQQLPPGTYYWPILSEEGSAGPFTVHVNATASHGCGDGTCDYDEDCVTCPQDCGECVCGDGVCDAPVEDCVNCPEDCGVCTYCTPCFTNQTDDWIAHVSFGEIDHTTEAEAGGCSYGNYTELIALAPPGGTRELTVSFYSQGSWMQCVAAWFDWDQDGVFAEDERYALGCGVDATLTAEIAIPPDAALGDTRFRVLEQYADDPVDPCVQAVFGEAEDYTLRIGEISGACCVEDEPYCVESVLEIECTGTFLGNETSCDSADCQGDGIPDVCQLADNDCNLDDIPDDCQLAANDCNGNEVPDDCDLGSCAGEAWCADCNQNDTLDECDIAVCAGALWCNDCNANGVPDGCEEDCNDNQIPDDCDLADCDGSLWCQDCNANGAPDVCDLDGGGSADCQPNDIPDECEADCNDNRIPDDCDLRDCDGSFWCDDCQPDGVLDACQLWEPRARYTYQYDDGTHEDKLGLTSGGTIAWLNRFNVQDYESAVITSISLTWGAVPDGTPCTVYLWSDPNRDGSPTDAKVLASAATVVAHADTDVFTVVDITDTFVGPPGTGFFVGALLDQAAGEYPCAIDLDSYAERSWVMGDTGYHLDPNDLAGGDVEPILTEDTDYDGNWLIRAEGISAGPPPYDCNENGRPDECDLADGTSRDCDESGVPDECEWLCGDLDDDGDCDVDDFWLFAGAFGYCSEAPAYLLRADLDCGGCVTLADYRVWVQCYRAANP